MTEPAVHSLYFTTAEPTGCVVSADIDRNTVRIRIRTCHCTDHTQRGPRIDTVIFNSRP